MRTLDGDLNWLFLPGGPGLGSESLSSLVDILDFPGALWMVDLPGDGSNVTTNNQESFAHWSKALIEVVFTLNNVILVAHSTGGMYALATPELQQLLKGLMLMDSAPDASWQQGFATWMQAHPLSELEKLQQNYRAQPSSSSLKALTVASAPYLFTPEGLIRGRELLERLLYNAEYLPLV